MEERLQKILGAAGVASRRAAERLILAGRVTVDGKAVTELGTKWDPTLHEIRVDDRPLGQPEQKVYLLLHKPRGVLSAAKDDRGRPTARDLLPGIRERVYPVGRLDWDTDGLLLMTNDGALTQGLLHPRYEVEKTYLAQVDRRPGREAMEQLRKGIELEDGRTAPAKARQANPPGKGGNWVELTIHEGRNRQVRRMLAAVGCDVLALTRTHFAGLELADLAPGACRRLTGEEVARLRRLAGTDAPPQGNAGRRAAGSRAKKGASCAGEENER